MSKDGIYSGCVSIAFCGDLDAIQKTAQKFIGKANVSVSADYETKYMGNQSIRLGGRTGRAEINIAMISAEAVEKIIRILQKETEKQS